LEDGAQRYSERRVLNTSVPNSATNFSWRSILTCRWTRDPSGVIIEAQPDWEVDVATQAQSPNIFPFMRFRDADAGMEWLSRAFGFEQQVAYRSDDNAIQHAQMSLGPGIVMLGQGDPEHRLSQGIYIAVDDVDAHYERAKAAGAEIVREIADTDYESREYTARDPEGHLWSFGTYHPKVADREDD